MGWQIWSTISKWKINGQGIKIWQWPGLWWRNFSPLVLWNNMLIRLHKICIIRSTFTTYYSNIIDVGSYIVSIVETFVNVLVFAHRLYFYCALTAHRIVLTYLTLIYLLDTIYIYTQHSYISAYLASNIFLLDTSYFSPLVLYIYCTSYLYI